MSDQKGNPMAAASPTLHVVESRLSDLFRTHHRRVLTAAYRITGSMADAEDVAQAVFLRIAGIDTPAVTNAGSYLYRAAINGALDLLRRRKAAPASPLEDAVGIASSGQ